MATTRTDALPREGDLFAGRFRVQKVLGTGGMGVVIAATEVGLGRPVAVKVMLPHLARQGEFEKRFLREARATAALSSQHVARVLDAGRLDDGELYLVMELLSGIDLEMLLRKEGPLPVEKAVGYVREACDAIAEAHSLGIIHRDLKPSNLFLADRPGAPPLIKVLDFGIAKPTGPSVAETDVRAITATDTALGSPQYMSPEQFRSAGLVDTRADLWSLGMILHRLLTNRLAFEASSVGDLFTMLVGAPPAPLRAHRPEAPAELEGIILRCLQKEPERRFQNAGQLAVALAPFAPSAARLVLPRIMSVLGEEAVSSRPPPLERTTPPPLRAARGKPSAGELGRRRSLGRLRVGLLAIAALAASVGLTVAVRMLFR